MTKEEIEQALNENTRAFLLMARYGKANLFRDLNRRFMPLLKLFKESKPAKTSREELEEEG